MGVVMLRNVSKLSKIFSVHYLLIRWVCCLFVVLFVRDEPTKLDYDVLLALNVNEEPLDSTTYPCISTWLNLVHTFSEREQKK